MLLFLLLLLFLSVLLNPFCLHSEQYSSIPQYSRTVCLPLPLVLV
jgi:hypothetical protein